MTFTCTVHSINIWSASCKLELAVYQCGRQYGTKPAFKQMGVDRLHWFFNGTSVLSVYRKVTREKCHRQAIFINSREIRLKSCSFLLHKGLSMFWVLMYFSRVSFFAYNNNNMQSCIVLSPTIKGFGVSVCHDVLLMVPGVLLKWFLFSSLWLVTHRCSVYHLLSTFIWGQEWFIYTYRHTHKCTHTSNSTQSSLEIIFPWTFVTVIILSGLDLMLHVSRACAIQ